MKSFIWSILFLTCLKKVYALTEKELPRTFDEIVQSSSIVIECDADKGDEKGPFGLTYKEGKITHSFLVMTGVYYDTCKSLEKNIRLMKKNNKQLRLIGSEPFIDKDPNEVIWRWRSVRTISEKKCYSYFVDDCKK